MARRSARDLGEDPRPDRVRDRARGLSGGAGADRPDRWPTPGEHNFFRGGPLTTVIDFGTSGVGDPACDLVIAWTFLTVPGQEAFRRARNLEQGSAAAALPRRDIERILADHLLMSAQSTR